MGNAFNGHCDGANIVPAPNITVKLSDKSNIGSEIKTQTISPVTFAEQEQLDLRRCTYTPSGNKTSLPAREKSLVSKLYNSNKFIVNNITVNNSCNQIPRGLIIAWYGKTVPDGWALCDGTNCTPDLRGRSILGFDSVNNKNKIGQIGGEESHLLSIGELPLHNHKYALSQIPVSFLTDAAGCCTDRFPAKTTNAVPYSTYLNETTNSPHNNMPPFVVCSYIMKL
jgi:microcystin-dependent protein